MKKNKKRITFLSAIERFLYKLCIVIIVLLIVSIVFSETKIAQINIEVQNLEREVMEQKKVNDSLEMKIDEMTSLDNINEISEEFGLSYNSDNIKTIE